MCASQRAAAGTHCTREEAGGNVTVRALGRAGAHQAGPDLRDVPAVPLPLAFHHSPECTSRLDTLPEGAGGAQ